MRISVEYQDTDVSKILEGIITHKNKDEFVKLLTPIICNNSNACTHLFRLLIEGNKLPDVIPNGTLCKMSVSNLGYGANKELIQEKYADADGNITVTVNEFRGYHEYASYEIIYSNVYDDGSQTEEKTFVGIKDIYIIEEF
jgi:hypothetical protein